MMKCNVCGCEDFIDMKSRKRVKCQSCGSLERTRLLWLYLQETGALERGRILHLAPEKGIHRAISSRSRAGDYVCADIDPARYKFASNIVRMDLCDLDREPSFQFDLILHSHVMEHIPCNIAYTLFHLHRMLKPDGVHLCIIPFLPGRYDECFEDIGDEERLRRFGQHDHVRRFGNKDIGSHLGKLLKLPESFDATQRFPPEVLRDANIPEGIWRGFHTGTILQLKRDDMMLLRS